MKKLLPLILFLFSVPCFGETYLCIGEDATGFDSGNNFSRAKFIPNKWIVKPFTSNTAPDVEWAVFQHGEDFPMFYCEPYTFNNKPIEDSLIYCQEEHLAFRLNKKTLKYVYSHLGHYFVDRIDSDDMILEYGKCSKI